jgi:hypothetical protein
MRKPTQKPAPAGFLWAVVMSNIQVRSQASVSYAQVQEGPVA